jgi:DNA integrity scanning protein DisA with diadenylate cyclase activity
LEGGTILREVLEQLETWAAQTYEGQRVVTSIGLVPATATPGPSIRNFWDQDFAHVLTNGFDTIILFDSNGMHAGFMQLSVNSSSKTGPYRLRQISEWAKGKKIAAVLNRHGEILIFKDRSLRFAKRRGRWVHYVHETNVRRLSPPRNRPFRDQLYASCLDVSFARTGGCIGILDADRIDLIGRLASVYDIISDRASYKTQLLYSSTKPNFQSLDRRFRQEMISMDGAVILDHQGHVLAAGAIVKVPAGSAGGGRLAAANELSKSGLGIKISQDGTIIALRNEVEVFRA